MGRDHSSNKIEKFFVITVGLLWLTTMVIISLGMLSLIFFGIILQDLRLFLLGCVMIIATIITIGIQFWRNRDKMKENNEKTKENK